MFALLVAEKEMQQELVAERVFSVPAVGDHSESMKRVILSVSILYPEGDQGMI